MRRAKALVVFPLCALLTAACLPKLSGQDGGTKQITPALRLVAYDSCPELLTSVRAAASDSVSAWGLPNGREFLATDTAELAAPQARAGAEAPPGIADPAAKAYSGTNTHESGVDEPDLVKTDGKRVVAVLGQTLHVYDAASHRETARLPLGQGTYQLLLHGDRLLVLQNGSVAYGWDAPAVRPGSPTPYPFETQLKMIDLAGFPRIIGEFRAEGNVLDARQVGSIARVVVRHTPQIAFPAWEQAATEQDRLRANRRAINSTEVSAWLPDYSVNGEPGEVECHEVSRPRKFSGAGTVTLFSFDLTAPTLTSGSPLAVFADAETVYGSGPNLYLAHDERWNTVDAEPATKLFMFDVTGLRPVHVASGEVPGWLLNQYSLSEYDDVLRVATTMQHPWGGDAQDSSSVYTLRRMGGELVKLGQVDGLGKGERIYAVRFIGYTGYVVTFRQTDPLYTIDMRDPRRLRVLGELKILGYSAYLHPVDSERLIGVGQDATEQGRVRGTQVSLFDIGKLEDPQRVAQYRIPGGQSEAEYDPHAFLYWPATRLLVIPVSSHHSGQQGALLLNVGAESLTEVGWVTHDHAQIRRALVIGSELWTISDAGVKVSTLDGRPLTALPIRG